MSFAACARSGVRVFSPETVRLSKKRDGGPNCDAGTIVGRTPRSGVRSEQVSYLGSDLNVRPPVRELRSFGNAGAFYDEKRPVWILGARGTEPLRNPHCVSWHSTR